LLLSTTEKLFPLKTYSNEDYPSNGDGDEKIPIGQTWVGHLTTSAPVKEARRASLKNAFMASVLKNGGLDEKMVFFWHNHFGVNIDPIYESYICWEYHDLMRRYALGNFQDLVTHMTINPAMLIFLNGDGSKPENPNRNYARELFERFTLGLGKYTEQDIADAAVKLSGWEVNKARGFVNYTGAGNMNDFETLISDLFRERGNDIAFFLAEKLMDYFIGYTDHPAEEIAKVASALVGNKFDIKPALQAIFTSAYFSDPQFVGCQIKSPLELIASVYRDFSVSLPWDKPVELYRIMSQLRKKCAEMGLDLGEPPSVKGWDPFTQAPDFDKLWYTSDAAVIRAKFLDSLFDPWTFQLDPPYTFWIDVLESSKGITGAEDPNTLLATLVERMFPLPWTKDRLDKVKVDILLTGQAEDRYWTNAWNRYLAYPYERNTAVVKERLTALYKYLVSLEEYQLQ